MKKINYFDTPMERRKNGNLMTNIMSWLLGFKEGMGAEEGLVDENLREEAEIEAKVENQNLQENA